jgi:hypothetical protein
VSIASAPLGPETFELGELMTGAILEGRNPKQYPEVLIGLNSFGLCAKRHDARWGLDLALQLLIHGATRFSPWKPSLITVSPDPSEGRAPTPVDGGVMSRHYLINGQRAVRRPNLKRVLEGKSVWIATDFVHTRTSLRHVLKALAELGARVEGISCWVVRDPYEEIHRSFTTPVAEGQKALPGYCPSVWTFAELGREPSSTPHVSSGEIHALRE